MPHNKQIVNGIEWHPRDWQTKLIRLMVSKTRYKGKTPAEAMADVMHLRNVVSEMVVELFAVKPIRPPKKELQSPPRIELVLVDTKV